jgi:hypothetical protein
MLSRLHGWKYVDSEEGLSAKSFWVFIIVVVLAASAYLFYINTDDFDTVTVVTRSTNIIK